MTGALVKFAKTEFTPPRCLDHIVTNAPYS